MTDPNSEPLAQRLTSRRFLMPVIGALAGFVLVLQGSLDANVWFGGTMGGSAAYGLANVIGKVGTPKT